MSNDQSRDLIIAAVRESKKQEKSHESKSALESLQAVSHLLTNIHSTLNLKVTVRISSLCNKLAAESGDKANYLQYAEQILTAWVNQCKKEQVTTPDQVKRSLGITLNNWATLHQSRKGYHSAMTCLLRVLKLLEDCPQSDVEAFCILAKARYNASSLYIELKRYQESLGQSQKALALLQHEFKLRRLIPSDNQKVKQLMLSFLCVYYNIGFCEGSLGDLNKMRESYQKGLELAKGYVSEQNLMVEAITKALNDSYVTRVLQSKISFRVNNDPMCSEVKKKEVQSFNYSHALDTDRYYSQSELDKLSKLLNEPSSGKFVSPDEYFYSMISKSLNLEEDVKHLKPKSPPLLICKKDDREKQKICELRLRRHCKNLKVAEKGVDFIKDRLDYIQRQEEMNAKKIEVQLKSRMKILSCQRGNSTAKRTRSKRKTTRNNYNLHKDAIEDIEILMDNLSHEIKQIEILQSRGNNTKTPNARQACPLAISAWDRVLSPYMKLHTLRTSLRHTFSRIINQN